MRDLLVHNGTIYTLNARQPTAEALLVRGERIVAIGNAMDVRAAVAHPFEDLDLRGRVLIPGLTDAHIHLLWTGLGASAVDLGSAPSLQATLDLLHDQVVKLPAGAWVRGHGWDHSRWGNRWPTADDLDRVSAGHPVLLSRKDGHSVWLNSEALRRAGIDETTADPSGGLIQRDSAGKPTGILLENANDLGYAAVPDYTYAEKRQALRDVIRECNKVGLTSVHMPEGPDTLALFRDLYDHAELDIRGLYHLRYDRLDQAIDLGLRSGLGDHWVRIGGVKIFSDGSLGSCTCHMLAPFVGTQSNYGIPTVPEEELRASVVKAARNGIAVAIHAIGDRANRTVLDAIEQPAVQVAHCALPHRIEHAQHLDPADIGRFARLKVVASMQPIHATADMEIAERLLGPERCASSYAWRPLLERGAVLAFGSDAPVETFDPWAGIHAAVTRQRPDGTPPDGWYRELAVDLETALHSYVVGPAIASGEEREKGSLEVGKLADFVVVDGDPFRVGTTALRQLGVVHTVVGGRSVWEK